MLGTNNMQHMGFIMASTKSLLLDKWLIEIINRVHKYRKIYESLNIGTRRVAWNYLGSDIIDRLINTTKPNQLYRLNKHKINAFFILISLLSYKSDALLSMARLYCRRSSLSLQFFVFHTHHGQFVGLLRILYKRLACHLHVFQQLHR